MERFYDVTVEGRPLRLALHSTSVVSAAGRVRIDIYAAIDALTDTLSAEVALPADSAARAALASVVLSHVYPDQSYEELMRRRAAAQDHLPA